MGFDLYEMSPTTSSPNNRAKVARAHSTLGTWESKSGIQDRRMLGLGSCFVHTRFIYWCRRRFILSDSCSAGNQGAQKL